MPLNERDEILALDEILRSSDPPDRKQARIGELYQAQQQPDPSAGVDPMATAQMSAPQSVDPGVSMGGAGGSSSVADVAAPVPGGGGAGGAPADVPSWARGAGGAPPTEVLAQAGGADIPANLPASAPENFAPRSGQDPEALGAATPMKKAVAAGGEVIPKPGTIKKPGKAGPPAGPAKWLTEYMGAEGLSEHKPPKEPLAKPVTAPEESAFRALGDEQIDLAREQGDAERQAVLAGARAELAAVERQELVDAEMAKRELERTQQLQKFENDYRDMLAETDSEPIDSDRLWNQKSTGEKFASKMLLFISTLASGTTGQPNVLLSKMEADMDRDFAAQKANKAFKMNKLAAQGSLYDMARNRFSSESAVDASMREAAWRKIQAQAKNFMTIASDPARKAAAEQLVNAVETKVTDAERQRRLANETDTVARMRAAAAAAGAGRAREGSAKFVPGLGLARTEKDATDMREELANYLAAKRNFSRARQLGKSFSSGAGAFGVGTDEYHEADSLTQQLVTQVAKSYGGVITDADRDAASKEVPSLTSYGRGWETRLDAAERKLENNFRSRSEAKIAGKPISPIPE